MNHIKCFSSSFSILYFIFTTTSGVAKWGTCLPILTHCPPLPPTTKTNVPHYLVFITEAYSTQNPSLAASGTWCGIVA